MKNSLFGIKEQIENELDNLNIDENGVVDTTVLDELNLQLTEKIENIALYIKNIESFADQLENEISNLKKRQESYTNKAKSLREYLSNGMLNAGMDKYESTKCAISFRKAKSVKILDDTMIPDEYYTEKVTRAISKSLIKEAIANGKQVSGALVEETRNIQLK